MGRVSSDSPEFFEARDDGYEILRCRTPTSVSTERVANVRWSDVCEIVAFKADLLTTDDVCLEFRTRDGSRYIVDEDHRGFSEVSRSMEVWFNVDPSWFERVMQRPFARNNEILWTASPVGGQDVTD